MATRRRFRALVTVLFTDIVGSTEVAAELGDRRWRELLTRHHRIVRAALRRHRGREVDTAGDGVLAAFDEPEPALRCAWEIVEEVQALGIDLRAGLHVGQAELIDGKIGGLVIHTGARIAALAGPAEVLVSSTLTELVPGSGFRFEDRGIHTLKGVPGQHHVLAVSGLDGEDLPRPLTSDGAARRRSEITPPIVPRRTGLAAGAVAAVVGAILVFFLLRDTEPKAPRQGLPPSTLLRIDPSTDRVVDTIRRAPPIGGGGVRPVRDVKPNIAAGGGAVWVGAGLQLTLVDPRTEEVTRITTSREIVDVVFGHNAVWASAYHADVLMQIDPASLEETHTTDLGRQAGSLAEPTFTNPVATSLDSVWVGGQDSLVQVDPVDGRVIDRFRLDQAVDEIAASARDVWVVDILSRTLARFSTEELAVVETVSLQAGPDAIAAGEEGDVWLVNSEAGTVTPVRDGRPREPIRVGSRPVDIAAGPDAIWIADQENGTVTRIDPSLGRIDKVIDIGAPVRAIAVDPSNGAVWAYVL
jgi:class 3 adenylate cyclase